MRKFSSDETMLIDAMADVVAAAVVLDEITDRENHEQMLQACFSELSMRGEFTNWELDSEWFMLANELGKLRAMKHLEERGDGE